MCHFKFFFGSLTLISCSFSAPLAEKIHSISFESPNHVPIISCIVGIVVSLLRHLILHQGTHYNRCAFRTVYRKKEKNKANLSNSSVFFNKRVGRTFFTKMWTFAGEIFVIIIPFVSSSDELLEMFSLKLT